MQELVASAYQLHSLLDKNLTVRCTVQGNECLDIYQLNYYATAYEDTLRSRIVEDTAVTSPLNENERSQRVSSRIIDAG